jgi:hypothetical protein
MVYDHVNEYLMLLLSLHLLLHLQLYVLVYGPHLRALPLLNSTSHMYTPFPPRHRHQQVKMQEAPAQQVVVAVAVAAQVMEVIINMRQ